MSALPERSESGVAAEGAGSSSSLESSDGLGALKGAGAVRAVSTTAGGAAAAAPSAAGGAPGGMMEAGAGSSPSPSPIRATPRAAPPTLTRSHTLGPSAASLEKERMEKPSALSRVFNPPKLERKHSSGDLHSRLKTRKILGVGETDNGDIHRSKISQVLGHNEHLYVKLPKGFWSAHVIMGAGVTMEAVLLLLAPSIASSLGVTPHLDEDATPAARVAGAALAGLCVFVWSLLGTSDKHYARTMLLSMITYHVLAVCVAGAAAFTEDDVDAVDEYRLAMVVALRAAMCLLCLAYFYSIAGYTPIRGQKPSGFPQSSCSRKEN